MPVNSVVFNCRGHWPQSFFQAWVCKLSCRIKMVKGRGRRLFKDLVSLSTNTNGPFIFRGMRNVGLVFFLFSSGTQVTSPPLGSGWHTISGGLLSDFHLSLCHYPFLSLSTSSPTCVSSQHSQKSKENRNMYKLTFVVGCFLMIMWCHFLLYSFLPVWLGFGKIISLSATDL